MAVEIDDWEFQICSSGMRFLVFWRSVFDEKLRDFSFFFSGIDGAQSRTMVALLLNVCHRSFEHGVYYVLLWEFKIDWHL